MSRWRRHPSTLWRRSSDRVVLLTEARDDILLLEGVGAMVWALLEEPATAAELAASLGDLTDTTAGIEGTTDAAGPGPGTIEDVLSYFLAELEAAGALETTP